MAEKYPEALFLEELDTTPQKFEWAAGELLAKSDHADLYFECTERQGIVLQKGKIKRVGQEMIKGVGARVLAGNKMGLGVSDEISMRRIRRAASEARHIAEYTTGREIIIRPRSGQPSRNLYKLTVQPLDDVGLSDKVKLLREVDEICRAHDSKIQEVVTTLAVEKKDVMIVTRDGRIVTDTRPLLRLNVTCIAVDDHGLKERGISGGGGRIEYACLFEDGRYKEIALQAARQALVNLHAVKAPAGEMDVVLGHGWPGILLHEAVGHGLEGDFNRKKVSAFTDRIGQRVATELCTVVDDGTIPGRRGSLNMDDEGTPTQRNYLIEKGVLVGYMHDLQNAMLMGQLPTGNGRRESYAHYPMPRMTNTFMLPGDASPEDIIRSVKKGIYAVAFSGGQVNITNGKFVFSMSEAYLIEDGKVTAPVKGATLIGNGPDVLTRVNMVGNDLELDPGIGTCDKDGQSVPVGVGLPTIRIDGITVGGSDALKEVTI